MAPPSRSGHHDQGSVPGGEASEQSLGEPESRLTRTLEAMSDAFFTLDRDWRFTYLNAEACRVLERARDEVIGRNVWDEFPEAVDREFYKAYHRAMRENRTVRFEEYYPPLDRWFSVNAHPSAEGLAVYFQDVTEERRKREVLRFQSQLLERVAHPIVALDGEGRVTYWNRTAERTFGWHAEEVIGQWALSRILQEEHEAAFLARLRKLGPGEEWSGELLLRRRDGEELLCWVAAAPADTPGGAEGGWIAVLVDMTELRRTQERLSTANGAASVGVFEWHEPAEFSWASDTLLRLYGLDPSSEAMDKETWLSRLHPEDRDRVMGEAEKAFLAGEAYDTEFRIIRPDGSVRWLSARGRGDPREEGRPRVIGVVQDITERKELESQLRQAQKMEAVAALSGGVAHDFNNRLTVIGGSARLIREEPRNEDAIRSGVEEILHQTRQAASLTRQLLAFGRRQVLDPRVLDLGGVVAKLLPMLQRTVPERIELRVDTEEEGATVHADRSNLEQVLLNLVANAADAIEGHGVIRLAVSRTHVTPEEGRAFPWKVEPGNYIEFRVSDTGSGMSPEIRARAFEPFFTTKEQERGTGLGLSMVYGTVKQSGGHVLVDTEPEEGTTFRILLPEADEGGSEGGAESPEAERLKGERSGTLLLVEDDPSVQRVLSRTLERAGYTVLLAGTPEEALELGEAHRGGLDAVVSDVVMPGMGGPELVDRLREIDVEAPVILMSGHAEPELGTEVHRDAAAFLNKPFNPEELLEILEGLSGAPPG